MKANGRLKGAICEAGLTQGVVAAKAGISQAYLSWAIRGRLNLTAEEKQRIASVLGKGVQELF